MKIGNHNTDDAVFVIAEIGNNHEGDFELAKEMIRLAAQAGANAVKFQTIIPEELISPADTERIAQLRKFQFSRDQFRELKTVADANGTQFLSTPFALEVVDWLDELVPAWKIASGDNDFLPLLERVAETGKPVIISMGLGHHDEAANLLTIFAKTASELALLHCVVSYPTPADEAALAGINTLKIEGVTPGYSDHTIGIKAAELSVAVGARIIEKHFTIDNNHSDFRDHQLSADPSDFAAMVAAIRQAERALGTAQPASQGCEEPNRDAVRRSLTAVTDIPAGTVLSMDQLAWVRPGAGIRPGNEPAVLGKPTNQIIRAGDLISFEHVS